MAVEGEVRVVPPLPGRLIKSCYECPFQRYHGENEPAYCEEDERLSLFDDGVIPSGCPLEKV